MKIEKDTVVSLAYDLQVSENNKEKTFVESTKKENPFTFLYGSGGLIKAFENNIIGLSIGDKFEFDIAAKEAYGLVDINAIVNIPKDIFKVDGVLDIAMLQIGKSIPMSDHEGNHLTGKVIELLDTEVKMDFNHALAGKDLHFKGEVLGIRVASAEEISHGHVHDGHHHHH